MTDEKPCPFTERWIDESLDELNRHEIEGGWRSICAMMLWRTANLLTCKFTGHQDFARQRVAALQWINGKSVGIVTFHTACEALNMDADEVREGLIRHAETANIWPINKTVPEKPPREPTHESSSPNPTALGVVARHQLRPRDLVGAAG
jgi:hypothetical protein